MRLDLNPIPKFKICARCKKRMPNSSKYELCNECLYDTMFKDVAEYIRTEDVTEIEVAEHFGIEVSIIKRWISEGRLSYRNTPK